MFRKTLVFFGMCAITTAATAACYTVYDGGGNMVYRYNQPPVDMTQSIQQSVPQKFGASASMVVVPDEDGCVALPGSEAKVGKLISEAETLQERRRRASEVNAENIRRPD